MVFPIYIAYKHKMGFTAGALLFCMLASMFYHLDENNDYGLLMDIFGVIVLASTGFHSAMHSSFLLTPLNLISAILCFAALYCYGAAGPDTGTCLYNDYHAAWHVLAAYSIAAYLYSHGHNKHRQSNPSRLSKPILVRNSSDHWEKETTLLFRELFVCLRKVQNAFMPVQCHHHQSPSKSVTTIVPQKVTCVCA